MRVLILGGTGSIGRAVAQRLLAQGHTVAVVHRESLEPEELREAVHFHTARGQLPGALDVHAPATHPGPEFRLGSMTELDVPEHSVAGILAWYSTIHLPPPELDHVLAEFRRLLVSSGMLVVGLLRQRR